MVSATTQLNLLAADGKKYKTDMLDSEGVIALAKNYPNSRAMTFLDWFLYSDNSLDGQRKKRALTIRIITKKTTDLQGFLQNSP